MRLWFSLPIFFAMQVCARAALSEETTFTIGNSACPEPGAVEREVRRLIPSERQSVLDAGVRIELQDLGDSYRVTVSKDRTTLKKSYADAARDCDGRARFAAVFAVLTIMPPELEAIKPEQKSEPPPPPAPPPRVLVAPPVREAEALPPIARIDLSGAFVGAPALARAPQLATWGGELGVALGRGPINGLLSVGYFARARFELESVNGDVAVLPASLGVRSSSALGPFLLRADLELLLLLERTRATNLARSNHVSALDFGARGGVSLARPIGEQFAPFVGIFTWIVPAPRELRALPQGDIGRLPVWWLGGAVGVSFGL